MCFGSPTTEQHRQEKALDLANGGEFMKHLIVTLFLIVALR